MSYQSRNYRHRNPKMGGEEKKGGGPFFDASQKTPIRKKKVGAFFQPKLTVGQPGDVYEKEADAVAGQVLQRLATSKEEEKLSTNDARMEKDKEDPLKPVRTKPMDKDKKKKEEKGIHKAEDPKKKKKKGGAGSKGQGAVRKKEVIRRKEAHEAPEAASAKIEEQAGKGNPLPPKVLAEMNKSFGMDFSGVRVHHDAIAAQLCCELNAAAFTHGMDIYFNQGKYDPGSEDGKLLLAHELTHVAQQHGATGGNHHKTV